MLNLISKLVNLILSEQQIWEIKNKRKIPSMEWSLFNIKKLGFESKAAIVVGAYHGDWTIMYKKMFPKAKVLTVEAQKSKSNILKIITEKLSATSFKFALLGANDTTDVTFNISDTLSSVLEKYKSNDFIREYRNFQALDSIVTYDDSSLYPDFLKLDVQGCELEVLKGATKILQRAQFVLCEVSLIEINKGCPLIADVILYMNKNGFILYNICSFLRSPLDHALWQTDLLFIKKNPILTKNKHWN